MKNLKKLLYFLTPHERKRAGLLLIMILIMALLDTIGVASILPLIAVLANPNVIETNIILNKMFQISVVLGVEDSQQFLFVLGLLVFVILITSLAFKAFTTYLQVRFNSMCQYNIGRRIIEGYLNKSYSWFLNRNSAELGKNILAEVHTVIARGLISLINFFTQICTLCIPFSLEHLKVVNVSKLAAFRSLFRKCRCQTLHVSNEIQMQNTRSYLHTLEMLTSAILLDHMFPDGL